MGRRRWPKTLSALVCPAVKRLERGEGGERFAIRAGKKSVTGRCKARGGANLLDKRGRERREKRFKVGGTEGNHFMKLTRKKLLARGATKGSKAEMEWRAGGIPAFAWECCGKKLNKGTGTNTREVNGDSEKWRTVGE